MGASAALGEAIGSLPFWSAPDLLLPLHDRTVAATRMALGEAAFAAAWTEGRAMSLEEAVKYALGEEAVG